MYKDLVVDKYKVVVRRHILVVVVVHHHSLVVEDNEVLDYMVDNLVVDLEVDNKLEHLQDNIVVVDEEVDHSLVDHNHLLSVQDHLVADNNLIEQKKNE